METEGTRNRITGDAPADHVSYGSLFRFFIPLAI